MAIKSDGQRHCLGKLTSVGTSANTVYSFSYYFNWRIACFRYLVVFSVYTPLKHCYCVVM